MADYLSSNKTHVDISEKQAGQDPQAPIKQEF